MNLSNGTLLQAGKYRIIRFISSGGFGCTYEAEHVLLHKRIAVKEFFVKDFCNRDETTSQVSVGITSKSALVEKLKKKFVEEAQSLCSLNHPNIVHVFDVFEENGTAYYVMDYIDGQSLNDLIKKEGMIGERQAIAYIRQVADALSHVHFHNRLHLDIKPGNIMVDSNGKAILIDFGSSKQYDEVGGENTSTLLGKTPGYAPLEQMGNDVVKFLPSTDIYALGATLYKMLSGITPPSATLLASGEPLKKIPGVSPSTLRAIKKAMSTNKMKRPQSVDGFLELLSGDMVEKQPKEVAESDNTILEERPVRSSEISIPPQPIKPKTTVNTQSVQKKPKSQVNNDPSFKVYSDQDTIDVTLVNPSPKSNKKQSSVRKKASGSHPEILIVKSIPSDKIREAMKILRGEFGLSKRYADEAINNLPLEFSRNNYQQLITAGRYLKGIGAEVILLDKSGNTVPIDADHSRYKNVKEDNGKKIEGKSKTVRILEFLQEWL